MLRDKIKDQAYFDKWISFKQNVAITQTRNRLPELELDAGKAGCVGDLYRHAVHLCIYRYSRGDLPQDMHASVAQILDIMELRRATLSSVTLDPGERAMYEEFVLSGIFNTATALAFLSALHFPHKDLLRAIELIGQQGKDGLLDRIAVALGDQDRPIAEQAKYPKIYGPLVEVIDASPEQRPALFKKYVESWYKRMKPIAWHGNHSKAEGAYFGYWNFESALVAMLFDIDDSALRDHPYYPHELVQHYRTNPGG